MAKKYAISVDRHSTFGIRGRGIYGLLITPVAASSGSTKEFSSDKELREALGSLGYNGMEIADILDALTGVHFFWKDTREIDESVVAALGFAA